MRARVTVIALCGAVVATGVFAISGSAGTAGPRVTAKIQKNDINFGKPARITGRVTGTTAAGQQVAIIARPYPYKRPKQVATATTNARGKYSVKVRPKLNTRYNAQLVANPAVQSKKDPIAWVYAKRGGTRIKFVGPARVRAKMYLQVWRDHPFRFGGRPLFFYFRKKSSNVWVPKARTRTRAGSGGKVRGSAEFPIPSGGSYRFFVTWCYDAPKGDIGIGRPSKRSRCPRGPVRVGGPAGKVAPEPLGPVEAARRH